jgi:hypothetical protein
VSNALSIATVTVCLRNILENAFAVSEGTVPSAKVTTLPPSDNHPAAGANIFLFHLTPNANWRNSDLPTRDGAGALVANPRAGLDLHYLITFYGDDSQLEAQRLLGIALRTFHTQPTLSRSLIEQTRAALVGPPASLTFLSEADLEDAPELVRLSHISMSTDELARLWSVFSFKTTFNVALVYQATVVLLDKAAAVTAAPPVQTPNVYVDASGGVAIDSVVSQPDASAPILPGSAIAILGRGFGNAGPGSVQVLIDGAPISPPPTDVTPTRIGLTLPAGIEAGTRGLLVALPRLMGTPPVAHVGRSSNLVPFVLRPQLQGIASQNVTTSVVGGQTLVAATLVATVNPAVGSRQKASLVLNQLQTVPAPPALSYAFTIPSRPDTDPPESTTLSFPITGVVAGTYVARVQIDGAASPVALDGSNPAQTVTLP